ncbi:peptidylprolyl isomerase [Propionivibrio limicola]|uniref:peptidylprolyl isomerase n=1 Tax=Propionivibrio limicola TaxID=167645 RepID=UPI00129204DB|nr:peptidylprolyl isomerase [Propionivibrio limicola]
MPNLTKLAAALFVGATLSATVSAADPFVTVNGVAISQATANVFMAEQKSQGAPDTPELKKAVREELIRRELLIQEAKKAGVDKKPEVAAQAEAARQALFIRAYVQDYIKKHPVSDAQLKADYERIKAQLGSTEYKARHILVKTEDEAKAIIASLKKGGKFDELAKQSVDPGTKENGGDLGWASSGNFVKPFAEALTGLSKGKYTETPIKTDFGFHVIQLDDTRPLNAPAFDEVKPRLLQQAQAQMITKMVEGLRAKAKVQ